MDCPDARHSDSAGPLRPPRFTAAHALTSLHGSGRAVDINRLDGERVSPSSSGAVAVQNAAANSGNIRENFGPTMMEKTITPGGSPTPVTNQKLTDEHQNHIHLSGQE